MSFLKLTYCQLIKIILSQIGGNPLQQVYSSLIQGVPMVSARSGIIPAGFTEVKNLIEQVTATINTAQQSVSDFSDTVERIGTEFYQNPIGTALTGLSGVANVRYANAVSALAASPGNVTLIAERDALANLRSSLAIYKTNSDRLSGVGQMSGSAAAGGCSLQDLLGSACAPNQDVPDIDVRNLIDSLKQGDAIAALKERLSSASGFSDYQQSLATFQSTVNGFNLNFNNLINKAAVRSAVTAQISQIVFNLITGCGNQVFNLTLKPDVKSALAPYAAAIQENDLEESYFDSIGNKIVVEETEAVNQAPFSNVSVTLA